MIKYFLLLLSFVSCPLNLNCAEVAHPKVMLSLIIKCNKKVAANVAGKIFTQDNFCIPVLCKADSTVGDCLTSETFYRNIFGDQVDKIKKADLIDDDPEKLLVTKIKDLEINIIEIEVIFCK